MRKIFEELISAYTPKSVTNVIKKIGEENILWENVGKRRNNLATINIGTDPAAGVTERITNAIDAVLEKEWRIQGEPTGFRSPRNAVEEWFKIEEGKLSKIKSARDKKIESLSNKVEVLLHHSGNEMKPTVEIRDKGIGLESEEFSKTILDLNGSNKIGKLHLMGAFGQGGSTALAYNNYTIILSKPFFRRKRQKKGKVSFTIVRINPGDIDTDKHEWYEYMTDRTTGQPFSIDIDNKTFEPGTLVRHILMDLGKYKGKITTPSNSLWYLSHNYLFDPIIPFKISDKRGKTNENRTVTGNNRLLTYTENLEYKNEVTQTFKTGKVTIYWWVLNALGNEPRKRILHYTSISKPIIITHNGQKQGNFGNGLIKKDLKLPYLDRYLIVHIEADYLDNDSKRQLFSSTRESLKDTAIVNELRKITVDTLKEDDKLQNLNNERKQRYFTKEDTQVLDSLKKRLAKRINNYLYLSGSGSSVTTSTVGESSPAKKLTEIPIEDPPTFFEITTPSPKEVFSNKMFSIKFKTDAHPNYFAKAETFAAFIEPQSIGLYTGTARVNNGHGIAYFKTNEETEIGDFGKISLELRPIGQKSISSTIELKIIERPENSGNNNNSNNKSPNIRVDFIGQNHPFFVENQWNNYNVASVVTDQDEVVIYVSEENKNLQKLVERAHRKNEEAVQNIKNKYLEHISFHAFVLDKNNPDIVLSEEDEEIPTESYEKMKESELRNASETVCGMINDFFELINVESIEEKDTLQ